MRLSSLRIKGFRGFADERVIEFSPTITVIYAPNSYGKTSVSEALEWLLYGTTWRVDHGATRDEYKGSFRNCHVATDCECFVEASMMTNTDSSARFRRVLQEDETSQLLQDDKPVTDWPNMTQDQQRTGRPFITQHALKGLLLVTPTDRFNAFSQLLGFDQLQSVQESIVQFCTKPSLPAQVHQAMARVQVLIDAVGKQRSMSAVCKLLLKGEGKLGLARETLERVCLAQVPAGTQRESLQPQLLRLRDEKVAKVFSGHVRILEANPNERLTPRALRERVDQTLSSDAADKLAAAKVLKDSENILAEDKFLELGLMLLAGDQKEICPFCHAPLMSSVPDEVYQRRTGLKTKLGLMSSVSQSNEAIGVALNSLQSELSAAVADTTGRATSLATSELSLPVLETLLPGDLHSHFLNITNAIPSIRPLLDELKTNYRQSELETQRVVAAIKDFSSSGKDIESLKQRVLTVVDRLDEVNRVLSEWAPKLEEAEQTLAHELDVRAQTEDVSIMIQCLDNWELVSKVFRIQSIIASLKAMKQVTVQFVSEKAERIVSQQFTHDVQDWYSKITTLADPDVGFSGFSLPRNADGSFKARSIQVGASSFGTDMKSAVSCLSESKLNALGLAMSISTYLKSNSPFEFLVIDDPIQSLDNGHETQFIKVVSSLSSEHGRQVILLSHNQPWLNQVRDRIPNIDGIYYEFTNFTASGPTILEQPWNRWQQRLATVEASIGSDTCTTVLLQQLEGEVRTCVALIVVALVERGGLQGISARKLGATDVRKHLLQCGVPQDLTDRIVGTFANTDPAHHEQQGYSPNKSRIRTYCSWCHELAKWGHLEAPVAGTQV